MVSKRKKAGIVRHEGTAPLINKLLPFNKKRLWTELPCSFFTSLRNDKQVRLHTGKYWICINGEAYAGVGV